MTSSRLSARDPLDCGHVATEISWGRCWPCHLADLRANGDGLRAERLERLKELQDAGRLTWPRLAMSLVAAYEEL